MDNFINEEGDIRIYKDPRRYVLPCLTALGAALGALASCVGLGLLLALSTGQVHIQTDCKVRETTIPEFPIYPNSYLSTDSPEISQSGNEVSYYYIYETHDSVEAVTAFYEEVGTFGNADPFGSYSIRIYQAPNDLTLIHVDLFWEKCSS